MKRRNQNSLPFRFQTVLKQPRHLKSERTRLERFGYKQVLKFNIKWSRLVKNMRIRVFLVIRISASLGHSSAKIQTKVTCCLKSELH